MAPTIRKEFTIGVLVVGVITCGTAPAALAQSRASRVQALAEEAVSVQSIDPGHTDFTDLEPLRELFARSRLVLLGEQTHGDGAAFLAKARMVRFLHQELGFDVLAFESGFYDCAKAQTAMEAGQPARTAIPSCVFGVWSSSAEFRPTVDYFEETRTSSRPLELAGFDSQPNGTLSSAQLVDDLRSLATEVRYEFDWELFEDILRGLADGGYSSSQSSPPPEEVRLGLEDELSDFADAVAASSVSDRAFWVQVIRSVVADAQMDWMQSVGARIDGAQIRAYQMGENLMWLLDHAYEGRKVIVWAHSFHNSRNLGGIDVESDDPETVELFRRGREMGDYLEERIGSEMYAVGFIAQEGEWGFPLLPNSSIPAGGEDTLEAMLSDAGFELAFLDLKQLEPSLAWLDQPVRSRLYDYISMTARWGDVMDGVFFVRRMAPSTAAPP